MGATLHHFLVAGSPRSICNRHYRTPNKPVSDDPGSKCRFCLSILWRYFSNTPIRES